MTTFDNREKAFENKFAHDEELMFKARARRNRLFGEWVATELGLIGDDVKKYAGEVISADLEEEGDEDIFRKVKADYEVKNIVFNEADARSKLDDLLSEAKRQVLED